MADKLAQRDERYAGLAGTMGELWPALIAKNPLKVRQAACKVLDECDRLAGGAMLYLACPSHRCYGE
jgi:hypothetical protein